MSADASFRSRLADNLAAIRGRIDAAALRSGRTSEEVTLIAVTKYVDAEVAATLFELGCTDLGESRPQDLWSKSQTVSGPGLRWHLVGHLQRNKVRRTLPIASLIHSADSTKLLEDLDRESASLEKMTAVLLEVNVSGDKSKHGFQPTEMPQVIATSSRFTHLDIRGLMTMASREGDSTAAREDFRKLRELRNQLLKNLNTTLTLYDLSMGMSGDFEEAIEEGATMVRIGSQLFEGLGL